MEHAKVGFVYTIETIDKHGNLVDTEVVHNLIPYEGINHMIGVTLKSGTPFTTWYIGLYEGVYVPVVGDTMATFPGLATETTAYAETTRQAAVFGTPTNGTIDNTANKAQFTGNLDGKLIQGGFISSTPAKGAVSGVLLSAVKFSSPKSLDNGSILRATAGFSIVSI